MTRPANIHYLSPTRHHAVSETGAVHPPRTVASTSPAAGSRRRVRVGNLAVLAVWLGLFLVPCRTEAADAAPTEYQVKAAYLFNFVKYVEWPANAFQEPASPFLIGVLGQDPFGLELDKTVAGRSINNRPILVRRLAGHAEAKQCHILFISASEKIRLEKILDSLQGLPVLTVADTDLFLDQGSVIDFVTRDNKVRFHANLNAARANQLKISSRLLSVADAVVGKPEGGKP